MTCRRCNGEGYIVVTDYVDYGSASVPLRQQTTCPECLDKNKCPLCGTELIEDGTECPDPECGYINYDLKIQYGLIEESQIR